jgi:hypothetical protein
VRLQRPELHTLTGSYTLDAVPGAEREEFEHHLSRCPSCAAEVRGLRETAARLGVAAADQPPAGMRERVLSAAGRTRQLPPLTEERRQRSAWPRRSSSASPRRSRRAVWTAPKRTARRSPPSWPRRTPAW